MKRDTDGTADAHPSSPTHSPREAPCITSSFQAEDVVLVHLLREVRPDMPVLFLDTFHHFAQTLTYRDEIVAAWKLNLINLRAPEPSVGLWQTSTDDCCARHKVGPLFAALEGYDTWFTGLRREQSASRANLQHDRAVHAEERKDPPQGQSAGGVDDEGRVAVREGARHPAAAALRARLLEHRLRAVHVAAAAIRTTRARAAGSGQKLECGIHIEPVKIHIEPVK